MTAADTAKKFTPTEQRIVDLLADGFAHTCKEVMSCLDDDLSSRGALRKAVCVLRGKLPRHVGIVCEFSYGYKYRMVHFVGGRGE